MINLTPLLCLLLLVHAATAQVESAKLNEDPVFKTVLSRQIVYPTDAERLGIYAKIYAGFHINRRGHIQDISILNPTKIGYGFEQAVTKKLRKLPPLNSKYEGNYALPVIFALVDYTNKGNLISPAGSLSNMQIGNRILLNEMRVISSKLPILKGKELAPFSRETNPDQ